MQIIRRKDVPHIKKPHGPEVWYYMFPEYEIHYNEQPAHSTQTWHYHNKINETLYIIEGELTAYWLEDNKVETAILHSGDVIETGRFDHTFENKSANVAKFLVLKQVLSGQNKSNLLKSDKVETNKN